MPGEPFSLSRSPETPAFGCLAVVVPGAAAVFFAPEAGPEPTLAVVAVPAVFAVVAGVVDSGGVFVADVDAGALTTPVPAGAAAAMPGTDASTSAPAVSRLIRTKRDRDMRIFPPYEPGSCADRPTPHWCPT